MYRLLTYFSKTAEECLFRHYDLICTSSGWFSVRGLQVSCLCVLIECLLYLLKFLTSGICVIKWSFNKASVFV